MKSIAYICSNPTFGLADQSGYATHIRQLTLALKNHAFVDLYLPKELNIKTVVPQLRSPDESSAPTSGLSSTKNLLKKLLPRYTWALAKDLHRIHLDQRFKEQVQSQLCNRVTHHVIERVDFPGPLFLDTALRNKISYFLEIHAPLPTEGTLLGDPHPLTGLFEKRILKALHKADGIFVVSKTLLEWVADKGVDLAKIHIVHNGVNLDIFDQSDRTWPEELTDAQKSRPIFGYSGSSLKWHQLDRILRAFGQTAQGSLWMIGSASQQTALRTLALELKIDPRIKWFEPRPYDRIPELLQFVDIGIVPHATFYQNPIKIYEYGSMNIAVVAPKTQPIEEILTHNETGFLYQNDSTESLTHALQSLMADSGLRTRIAYNLCQAVRQHCGWNHRARQITQILSAHET